MSVGSATNSKSLGLGLVLAAIAIFCGTWFVFRVQRWWASPAVALVWHLRHSGSVSLAGYTLPVRLGWVAAAEPGGWALERGGYGGAPRYLIMFLSGDGISQSELPAGGTREFTRPLPWKRISSGLLPVNCQSFGSRATSDVLTHCLGANGIVITAVGPPDIEQYLRSELQSVSRDADPRRAN